jgi:hypothetical protein
MKAARSRRGRGIAELEVRQREAAQRPGTLVRPSDAYWRQTHNTPSAYVHAPSSQVASARRGTGLGTQTGGAMLASLEGGRNPHLHARPHPRRELLTAGAQPAERLTPREAPLANALRRFYGCSRSRRRKTEVRFRRMPLKKSVLN